VKSSRARKKTAVLILASGSLKGALMDSDRRLLQNPSLCPAFNAKQPNSTARVPLFLQEANIAFDNTSRGW